MKYKYDKKDIVWVYQNSGLSEMIGIIADRDVNEKSYLVQDVINPAADRWVAEEYLLKLDRKKPNLFGKILNFFRN